MQVITSSNSAIRLEKKSSSLPPTLYMDPPTEELTLDQFELLSLDRLQLLRQIELLKARGFEERELNTKIREIERKFLQNKKNSASLYRDLSDIARDRISHFILRLAYCRTEDLRRWFLVHETLLFKQRLEALEESERAVFMKQNGMRYQEVSSEEKSSKEHKLKGLAGITDRNFITAVYYKVPFLQALQLIGSRSVYLERGMAFVPLTRLVHILTLKFRQNLSLALAEASKAFDVVVHGDSRIAPLLKNMAKQFVGNDFSAQKSSAADKLTLEQVDTFSQTHFPLCMRHLHNTLSREHKLKHWGRLQYTLFLKGAGLDLEAATALMQRHFSKVMSSDQFVKQYAYSFRHMFGKEGARKNYTPYSCLKVLNQAAPEPGAAHGCPFKHMNDGVVVSLLQQEKVGAQDTKEILTLAKQQGHFQLACQKHFDVTHPGHNGIAAANHPNQWFLASLHYHNKGSAQAGASAEEGVSSSAAANEEMVMEVDEAQG